MIDSGMGSLHIPFFDGNMFRKVTMSCTNDILINFVEFCMVCSGHQISRTPSFFNGPLNVPKCAHLWRIYVDALVIKKSGLFKFIFVTEISDGDPPVMVLGLNLFYTRYYLIFNSTVACLYCYEIYFP